MAKKEKVPRQEMPVRDMESRRTTFQEVALGYSAETAQLEAKRCIQCKKPTCIAGCPVEVDIPGFVALIVEGKFLEAYDLIKQTNSLPAICGRVCPQEDQCEKECVLGIKDEPVAIGRLERFAADAADAAGHREKPPRVEPTGKRIAIVGAGPAGLTCAGDLARRGHSVTIFEAL
ncbi:MAG TPA: NAD(P)-binding protein, partial [Sumerlaeia bacterium]|nr:NAD(P)-binding protein [Sumerlaeia bacterium]